MIGYEPIKRLKVFWNRLLNSLYPEKNDEISVDVGVWHTLILRSNRINGGENRQYKTMGNFILKDGEIVMQVAESFAIEEINLN